MTELDRSWQTIQAQVRNLEGLAGAIGLLEWDQQVTMPPAGAALRGPTLGVLSGLHHQHLVDPAFGEALDHLGEALGEGAASPLQAAAHRVLSRAHRRAVRVPEDLVRRKAEARSTAFGAWMGAREAEDFAVFAPALAELLSLVREAAACQPQEGHPYDALLQDFDPDASTAAHAPVFARLSRELAAFVAEVQETGVALAPLQVQVDEEGLFALSEELLRRLGFDLQRGRLDRSQHPFTVGLGPQDVRLTTHTYGEDLLGTLKGTVHECGHGLYEQGLPLELAGTGLMQAAGVSLHESQSRFWENCIGGSRAFFRWLAPLTEGFLPGAGLEAEALFRANSRVSPGHIRIKADEATYNLHIALRFELEQGLVAGEIPVAGLEEAWNDGAEAVGLPRPERPTQGVLQDVHWASGMFGYFPTYTMGNLMAARLEAALERDEPEVWAHVEAGDFAPVLGWLREKVHRRASLVEPSQIIDEACGEGDPVAAFMEIGRAHV